MNFENDSLILAHEIDAIKGWIENPTLALWTFPKLKTLRIAEQAINVPYKNNLVTKK